MDKVYIVHAKETMLYKIGYTSQPIHKRVSQLQTSCPHKIELIALVTHPRAKEIEDYLHWLKGGCRWNGEWFMFDEDHLPLVQEQMCHGEHVYDPHIRDLMTDNA